VAGISGELDGRPLPVSLGAVEECLDEIGVEASYVRVRSGLNEATEFDLAAGDAMVIPWEPEVTTTLNVVLAGQAILGFGDSLQVCASGNASVVQERLRWKRFELRISANGPVRVTGIEIVSMDRAVQKKERGGLDSRADHADLRRSPLLLRPRDLGDVEGWRGCGVILPAVLKPRPTWTGNPGTNHRPPA
jgi:hypothetical protein